MLKVIENQLPMPEASADSFIRPGTVVGGDSCSGVTVAVSIGGALRKVTAQSALSAERAFKTGDRVLVAGADDGECYILGPVRSGGPARRRDRSLETDEGASARIVEQAGEERIQVRDAEERVLFEYCPETRCGTLTMPLGDLRLSAPEGDIDLVAGKTLRCRGEAVHLASGMSEENQRSKLSLEHDSMALRSASLSMAVDRATVAAGETQVCGARLVVTMDQARMVYRKLETVAERIVQRARDLYAHVEDLQQTRAGRLRTLVAGALHLKSGHASVTAEEEVKINGQEIHLG